MSNIQLPLGSELPPVEPINRTARVNDAAGPQPSFDDHLERASRPSEEQTATSNDFGNETPREDAAAQDRTTETPPADSTSTDGDDTGHDEASGDSVEINSDSHADSDDGEPSAESVGDEEQGDESKEVSSDVPAAAVSVVPEENIPTGEASQKANADEGKAVASPESPISVSNAYGTAAKANSPERESVASDPSAAKSQVDVTLAARVDGDAEGDSGKGQIVSEGEVADVKQGDEAAATGVVESAAGAKLKGSGDPGNGAKQDGERQLTEAVAESKSEADGDGPTDNESSRRDRSNSRQVPVEVGAQKTNSVVGADDAVPTILGSKAAVAAPSDTATSGADARSTANSDVAALAKVTDTAASGDASTAEPSGLSSGSAADPVANPSSQLSRVAARILPGMEAKQSDDLKLNEAQRVQFVQRVARAFGAAAERDGTIRVRLSPPELGSLRLQVSIRDGAMTAQLETETPEARRILLENLPELRDRLAGQDVKVERFDVNVRDESQGQLAEQSDSGTTSENGEGEDRSGEPVASTEDAESADDKGPTDDSSDLDQLNIVI